MLLVNKGLLVSFEDSRVGASKIGADEVASLAQDLDLATHEVIRAVVSLSLDVLVRDHI